MAVTAKATLSITVATGEDVTRMAAAAGVINRASTSSAPPPDGQGHADAQQDYENEARVRTGTPRLRRLRDPGWRS